MKQGFIIPVYRHIKTTPALVEKLTGFNLPIILVDDGNDLDAKTCFAQIAAKNKTVVLVSLEKNMGKGGAFAKGMEKAAELGLTHVLQIDADGQHDIERVEFFLKESANQPENIICGLPLFDESAPKSRVIGRKISNAWAAIVTLCGELKDVHCGFRVYPVKESLRITRDPFMNKRMGFDTEILVRLYWNRVFPVFHPIKIIYPKDGISNFRMFKDNLHISAVFTRLCLGMFFRLPFLLALNIKRKKGRQ
jgi:glycosyltransferase involved in cell wall biosynthesis